MTQTDCREPAARHKLVALGKSGVQALDHQRAISVADREAQAIDPRFQPVLVDQSAWSRATTQQLPQRGAELSQAGLPAAFEYVVKSFNHAQSFPPTQRVQATAWIASASSA